MTIYKANMSYKFIRPLACMSFWLRSDWVWQNCIIGRSRVLFPDSIKVSLHLEEDRRKPDCRHYWAQFAPYYCIPGFYSSPLNAISKDFLQQQLRRLSRYMAIFHQKAHRTESLKSQAKISNYEFRWALIPLKKWLKVKCSFHAVSTLKLTSIVKCVRIILAAVRWRSTKELSYYTEKLGTRWWTSISSLGAIENFLSGLPYCRWRLRGCYFDSTWCLTLPSSSYLRSKAEQSSQYFLRRYTWCRS